MFDLELSSLTASVRQSFNRMGVPAPDKLDWIPLPFAGTWGFGTPACFQAAAAEAKAGKRVNVPERAQELARLVAAGSPRRQASNDSARTKPT